MLKTWTGVFAVLFSLAACAPMPVAEDVQDVHIEGTPGMAVIYLIRSHRDWSNHSTQLYLDERRLGTTQAGTYYRVEVSAGPHRITGLGIDQGTITIDAQANGVYFVEQTVPGLNMRQPVASSSYTIIDEANARYAMARGEQRKPWAASAQVVPRGSVTILPLSPSP